MSRTATVPRRCRKIALGSDSSPAWQRVAYDSSSAESHAAGTDSTSQARYTGPKSREEDRPDTSPTIRVGQAESAHAGCSLEELARFVGHFLRLARAGKPRAASDLAFDFFEYRFAQDEFTDCDLALQLINNLSFHDLSDTVLVAIMAVTYPARDRLGSRAVLVDHIHRHLVDTNGQDEADFIAKSYR